MRKIELLAPAKNAEIGIEAIRHGADAVYIGPPAFGARAAAGNSIEDIKRLCDFAHLFGAAIYITFNTILYDDELAEAERMIYQLYEAGADALIVKDGSTSYCTSFLNTNGYDKYRESTIHGKDGILSDCFSS